MTTEGHRRGRAAEDAALRQLQAAGLRLVARNARSRGGEIDLIMRDGDTLVFVEVRSRRSRSKRRRRRGTWLPRLSLSEPVGGGEMRPLPK